MVLRAHVDSKHAQRLHLIAAPKAVLNLDLITAFPIYFSTCFYRLLLTTTVPRNNRFSTCFSACLNTHFCNRYRNGSYSCFLQPPVRISLRWGGLMWRKRRKGRGGVQLIWVFRGDIYLTNLIFLLISGLRLHRVVKIVTTNKKIHLA